MFFRDWPKWIALIAVWLLVVNNCGPIVFSFFFFFSFCFLYLFIYFYLFFYRPPRTRSFCIFVSPSHDLPSVFVRCFAILHLYSRSPPRENAVGYKVLLGHDQVILLSARARYLRDDTSFMHSDCFRFISTECTSAFFFLLPPRDY